MKKILILLVALVSFFTACHKDSSSSKDCGCGSTVYKTVDNIKGILSWRQDGDKKAWTLDGVGLLSSTGPYDCTVCNSEAIDDLIDTENSNQIPVIFSGELYKICDDGGIKPAIGTNYFYIKLESLKKDLP